MHSEPRDLPAHYLLLGAHCAKRLWLQRYAPGSAAPRLTAPAAGLALLARGLFPGGVEVASEDPVAATQALIAAGAPILYDAAFRFNGLLTSVEILVRRGNRWYAYQTKCRASLKPAHLQEAALQSYVLRGAGLTLTGSTLLYLNKGYVRQGPLDVAQLFLRVHVTKPVRGLQPAIATRVDTARQLLEAAERPEAEQGTHCAKPHPCGFAAHCAAQAVPTGALPDSTPLVDRPALNAFLSNLRYPLSFMDFEAYQPPVPEFDGHWPFRQVPFQYSLHRIGAAGAPLEHYSFLAEGAADPSGAFLESLLRDAGSEGSVLVYGTSTEQVILSGLAADHPARRAPIEALKARIVDLSLPFHKKHVLLPALGERFSLKAVLPALVPGQGYDGLAITDGGAAHLTFAHLRLERDPARVARTRQDLLDYCTLDTLALVRILERLRELA
ncbi:DUF2779 domain-containing protein [Flaviaesturariibacter aridisoli]|nr:DUF2779 domain-containing protein [Flaviaesturariibacter aridisoli]